MDRQNPTQQLIELLHVEQQSIGTGDYAAIATIIHKKQQVMEQIFAEKPALSATDLKTIKSLAEDNLRLIGAAKRGLKSVRARLGDLERVSSGACTYRPDGRIQWPSSTPKKDVSF